MVCTGNRHANQIGATGGVVSYGCVCTIRGGNVPAAGLQIGGSVDIEIYLATKKKKRDIFKSLDMGPYVASVLPIPY